MKKPVSFFVGRPCCDDACVSGEPFPFHDLCVVNGVLKSDVALLRRADSMSQLYGMSNAKEFLDKVQQAFGKPLSPLAEFRKQMSDEDLFKCIKRRNCQTSAELQDWLEYVDIQELKSVYLSEQSKEDTDESKSSESSASSTGEAGQS